MALCLSGTPLVFMHDLVKGIFCRLLHYYYRGVAILCVDHSSSSKYLLLLLNRVTVLAVLFSSGEIFFISQKYQLSSLWVS